MPSLNKPVVRDSDKSLRIFKMIFKMFIKKKMGCTIKKFEGNRPFPDSNEKWRPVEVRVNRNTRNVWKCLPQPRSGYIRTHEVEFGKGLLLVSL